MVARIVLGLLVSVYYLFLGCKDEDKEVFEDVEEVCEEEFLRDWLACWIFFFYFGIFG